MLHRVSLPDSALFLLDNSLPSVALNCRRQDTSALAPQHQAGLPQILFLEFARCLLRNSLNFARSRAPSGQRYPGLPHDHLHFLRSIDRP
jgi:hypothetical protein